MLAAHAMNGPSRIQLKHRLRRSLPPSVYRALQRVYWALRLRARALRRFDLRAVGRTLGSYRVSSLPAYGMDLAGWSLLQTVGDFLGPTARESLAGWWQVGRRRVRYALKRHGTFVARPFTLDRVVLNEVLVTNVYKDGLHLADGDIVVDLGAHIGAFSVLAAQQARGARIYSYEPEPQNVELLTRNVLLNHVADQVTICPVAVGGTSGRHVFHVSSGGMGALAAGTEQATPIFVETVTLQDVFLTHRLDRINLLKVDIEAAEYEMFAALPEEWLARIDRIIMECHLARHPEQFPRLLQALERAGFACMAAPGARLSLRLVVAQRTRPVPVNGGAREYLLAR